MLIARFEMGHHHAELAAVRHQRKRRRKRSVTLRGTVPDLIIDTSASGEVRDDVAPQELVTYCPQTIGAASGPLLVRLSNGSSKSPWTAFAASAEHYLVYGDETITVTVIHE